MAHIIVITREAEPKALMEIHRTLDEGISSLREKIGNGEPIFEKDIFDYDYDHHAIILRKLISIHHEFSLPATTYQVPEGTTLKTCGEVSRWEITWEVLNNLLDTADSID